MKQLKFKSILIAASVLLPLFCTSCQDDLFDAEGRVEEGLPATVTLTVEPANMSERTRSIADEDAANYCYNLWIGFYSKDTDKLIQKYYFTDVEDTLEKVGTKYHLTIHTESHNKVYIVAVANSDVNTGITDVANYGTEDDVTLKTMLDEADTFTKFKKICVLRPDANDVNIYANTLTMSGWYSDTEPEEHAEPNIPAVTVTKGENNLTGAIYLKRIISRNKFFIVPDENINLTLNYWQVYNVPAGCHMLEQKENAGDRFSGSNAFYNKSNSSRLFTATTVTDDEGNTESGHTFEFYQVENKHDATGYAPTSNGNHVGIDPSAADFYAEREREFKNTSADNKTDTNTGVYRSLVNEAQTNLSNNNATYVVVNANIDYYVACPANYLDFDADEAEPVPADYAGKKIHRNAVVNYTIHLGYCEDKENGQPTIKTAQDFNCYRNTLYNYKVRIKGVKNVVVEAESSTENQPGVEGDVRDELGDYVELDSHYCEFNIALTDYERNHLSYRISAPYGGQNYYYVRDKNGNVEMTQGMNSEQYEWIKFYPTESEDVLAEYNGGKGKNSIGEGTGLWTFNDMCTPSVTPNNDYPVTDENEKRWYTVFIDEYTYKFGNDGTKETSWPYYCDQDDRIAEFIVEEHTSKDTESTYSYCKYAFAQKSIQTFFKGHSTADTAIGVEHVEETYCMNMKWDFMTGTCWNEYDYYDHNNGRADMWEYLTKRGRKWDTVLQATKPCKVYGETHSKQGTSHPDAQYPVYMPMYCSSSNPSENAPSKDVDKYTYYANQICMNRNRDLDGNNEITPDEVRWYLPTSAVYIEIAVSQSELPDPIMRFTDYPQDYYKEGYKTWYVYGTFNQHYITADYQYYWAEQWVTTGTNPFSGWAADASWANTVRCVRNLGTDMSKDVEPKMGTAEVGYAFTYDENDMTFTQDNFRDETLRGYNLGAIAPHDFTSPSAKPYKKFQIAKHLCSGLADDYVSFNSSNGNLGYVASSSDNQLKTIAWKNSLKINGICGQYTQEEDKSDLGTWRVPTASELAIMWIQGIPQSTETMESGYLGFDGTQTDNCSTFSCTYDYFVSQNLCTFPTDNHVFVGYNDVGDRQVLAMDCLDRNQFRLRCVRDVRVK